MLIGRRQIAKDKNKKTQRLKIHPVKKDNKKLRKRQCTGIIFKRYRTTLFSILHILVSTYINMKQKLRLL